MSSMKEKSISWGRQGTLRERGGLSTSFLFLEFLTNQQMFNVSQPCKQGDLPVCTTALHEGKVENFPFALLPHDSHAFLQNQLLKLGSNLKSEGNYEPLKKR